MLKNIIVNLIINKKKINKYKMCQINKKMTGFMNNYCFSELLFLRFTVSTFQNDESNKIKPNVVWFQSKLIKYYVLMLKKCLIFVINREIFIEAKNRGFILKAK